MAIPPGTPCNQWLTAPQFPPQVPSPWPTPIYAACNDVGGTLLFYFDPQVQAWYWEIPGAPPGTNTLSAAQKAVIVAKLGAVTPSTCPTVIYYFDCAAVQGAFPWALALGIGVGIAALAWVAARRQT